MCAKRGRATDCVYQEPTTRNHGKPQPRLSSASTSAGQDQLSGDVSRETDAVPTPDSMIGGLATNNDEPDGPRSRTLLSSKFQKGSNTEPPLNTRGRSDVEL